MEKSEKQNLVETNWLSQRLRWERFVSDRLTPLSLTEKVAVIVENKPQRWWRIGFGISLILVLCGVICVIHLLKKGLGVWGLNYPVAWAFDITNFVFWIGIGHAGTLISAILFLLHQRWRTSINRAAEAMTLFAVVCAFIYPIIHTGRPWYVWWLIPVPDVNGIYQQYRSPLQWDVFAIITYFTLSLLFCYIGMLPDLAILRDRAKTRIKKLIYGALALDWVGSHRQWYNYERAYLILAGLLTPLVISVHSIVSYDFAVSLLPGWHSTIFPPYFVAGAIFSGIAMVLTILIPLRKLCGLTDIITLRHIDILCKIALAAGSIVAYAYLIELFGAFYTGDRYELREYLRRVTGSYFWAFWFMIICNVFVPQLFWFKNVRSSVPTVFVLSVLINIGMWCERFVIVTSTLSHGFMPGVFGVFRPTMIDILTFTGSIGLFFMLFLLFVKYFPIVAIAEVKGMLPETPGEVAQSESTKKPLNIKELKGTIQECYGVLAEFSSANKLKNAVNRISSAGYRKWDVFSPFPVLNVEKMVFPAHSRIGWFTFLGGVIGACVGVLLVWYLNAVSYPTIVSRKPLFSIYPTIPVAFEIAILFAGLAAVISMIVNSYVKTDHTLLLNNKQLTNGIWRNKFYIFIDATDLRYSDESAVRMLESAGADNIELIGK